MLYFACLLFWWFMIALLGLADVGWFNVRHGPADIWSPALKCLSGNPLCLQMQVDMIYWVCSCMVYLGSLQMTFVNEFLWIKRVWILNKFDWTWSMLLCNIWSTASHHHDHWLIWQYFQRHFFEWRFVNFGQIFIEMCSIGSFQVVVWSLFGTKPPSEPLLIY